MSKFTNNKTTIIYTRVAWFDRDSNSYNFGAWHNLNKRKSDEYFNLQKWIVKQNKKYPRTKYWLEIKDNHDNLTKNCESCDLIPIVKDNHDDISYTEWLAL